MEATLDQALSRLFGGAPGAPVLPATTLLADVLPTTPDPTLTPITLAQDHYARALRAQRDGDWALYGEEIERLGEVLQEMQESGGGQN